MSKQTHQKGTKLDDEITLIVREHATAIGSLCMYWALLEEQLIELIQSLMNVDDTTVACIVTSTRDISVKCEIARRLALHKIKLPEWKEWIERLIEILDLIQTDMSPKRNRYVHDSWRIDKSNGDIVQTDSRVRAKKLKAHEPLSLVMSTKTTAKTTEVWQLQNTSIGVMLTVAFMATSLDAFNKTGKVPEMQELMIKYGDLRRNKSRS